MDLTLLEIPDKNIVVENYDDEMIFLNLIKGVYYSLSRPGADAVIALTGAASIEQATEWMLLRYDSDETSVSNIFHKITAELLGEELIIPLEIPRSSSLPNAAEEIAKMPFIQYAFEKYQDVEDILKFDPVHDVDEQGWPSIQEEK